MSFLPEIVKWINQVIMNDFFVGLLITLTLISGFYIFLNRRRLQRIEFMLKEKEKLTASIAHDLKNPLSVVKLYAQMMEKAGPEAKVLIQQELDKVLAMVEDMLQYSKATTNQIHYRYEMFEVNAFLKNKVELMRRLHPNWHFVLNLPNRKHYIECDRLALDRIMNNLMQNAIKYSNTETTVTVTLKALNHHFIFSVKDEGKGISEKDKKHIFDPYFQVEGGQGIGMGLYIVKQMVSGLVGTIDFESEPGKGTTFYVNLPKYKRGER